jgi:hypothetical protein
METDVLNLAGKDFPNEKPLFDFSAPLAAMKKDFGL